MTSTVFPSQNPLNSTQTSNAASSSVTGTTSQQVVGPGQASACSYASATKKQFSPPPIASSTPQSIAGGPLQHGKQSSLSPVNGKNSLQPAVPVVGPPIVNSSSIFNGTAGHAEHSRNSSVAITGSNSSGYLPNGNSAANSRPNICFGSVTSANSPAIPLVPGAMHHQQNSSLSMRNPRVISPTSSPTPIPRPMASGGKPPSGLQSQGNGLNFGSLGEECNDHNARPVSMPSGPHPLNAQAQHLPRESPVLVHNDLGAPGMNMNRGYQQGAGRGRGFNAGYSSSVAPSPGQSYSRLPNQPGRSNIQPQYQSQAPIASNHTGSPFRATRSPAVQPATMQQSHVVSNPQMSHGSYAAYTQHLQPQQSIYSMQQQGYDHPYPGYFTQPYGIHTAMPFQGTPPSPRPYHNVPHNIQQPYMPSQYGNPHAQSMSRTPSQMSERPSSTIAQPTTPSATSVNHASHNLSQGSGSPAQNANFTIPKKTEVVIKNNDGEVLTFEKNTSQTSVPCQSPVVVSSPSCFDQPTESSHSRSDIEIKHDFQNQVKKQYEAEKAAAELENQKIQKIAKEETDAKAQAEREKEEAERKAALQKEQEEKELVEAEMRKKEQEMQAKLQEEEEERKKLEEEEKERLKREEEERENAAFEEMERQEEERERAYQEKKKKEMAEKEAKEAQEAEKASEDLRRAEAEAEAREEARQESKSVDDDSAKMFAQLKKSRFGPQSTSLPTVDPSPVISMPPPAPSSKSTYSKGSVGKPKPAALNLEANKSVEPAQPTAGMQALKSARFILVKNETVNYPDGIKSPDPALNLSGKGKGMKYDQEFLYQFQSVYTERPSTDWDKMIKETVGESDSSRNVPVRSSHIGGRQSSRPGLPPVGSVCQMGTFGHTPQPVRTLPSGTTSQERFMNSSQSSRVSTMTNPLAPYAGRGFPMGPSSAMSRSSSMHSMPPSNSPLPGGSQRGKGSRRGMDKVPSRREEEQASKTMPLTANMELKPLDKSSNGWRPPSIAVQSVQVPSRGSSLLSPDMVQRKVKAALNKMTPEKFHRISDQILNIAAQSIDEDDGRTLRQVIQLTFEKACDEAHWASMYAKFCKCMLENVSNEIKDENVKDKSGNVVVGGALFRKYLLNRCQEEFERGWEVNLPEKLEGQTEEAVMLSDEYYIAAAAKRRGLGLIQFIGELYKLGMLTRRIMHDCVMKLLDFKGKPDESGIESLVKLLRTVGATMYGAEAGAGSAMIECYFDRIEHIMSMEGLPSRLYFMLLDTVDLKKNGWRSKDDQKGPKTLQEIHDEVAVTQQRAEMERQRQNPRGSGRPHVGRGDPRSFSSGGMVPSSDYTRNMVPPDDLKRLKASIRNTGAGSQIFEPPKTTFSGPRTNSGGLWSSSSNMSRSRDESGDTPRAGVPAARDEKSSTVHANTYGALASLDNVS